MVKPFNYDPVNPVSVLEEKETDVYGETKAERKKKKRKR